MAYPVHPFLYTMLAFIGWYSDLGMNEDKWHISKMAQTPIRPLLLDRFPLSFPPRIRYSLRWLQ